LPEGSDAFILNSEDMKDLGSQAKGKPVFPGCPFKEYRAVLFQKVPIRALTVSAIQKRKNMIVFSRLSDNSLPVKRMPRILDTLQM
jgi:hypothetical protein